MAAGILVHPRELRSRGHLRRPVFVFSADACQVFARIVERQATNVVRGGFGMLNPGQAFPALADVLDVVSPPPSSQR